MPFKSEAQRGYFHANMPDLAKKWDKETPKGAKLPYHIKDKKDAIGRKLKGMPKI